MHVALHLWCPACTLILKQLAYNAVCSPVLSRSLSPSLSLGCVGHSLQLHELIALAMVD